MKIPVQGRELLLSTGRTDYGVQARCSATGVRNAFYVNTAAVYYAGASQPAFQESQVIPTLIVGYEFKWTERTNLNLQVYASPSVYDDETTDLDELTATKYEYSLGLRHRFDNWLVTAAFTENVQNINNTPDIGLSLGWPGFRTAARIVRRDQPTGRASWPGSTPHRGSAGRVASPPESRC